MLIYLAGGLFNAGERLHNLYLEKHLKELDHEVILPQRRALEFFANGKFDTDKIVADCMNWCMNGDVLYVGSVDGPDANSGGSVEYGMTIAATGRAIVYRTDFRTATERELGVNAMFGAKWSLFIYQPCFLTELGEIEGYYRALAKRIHEAIIAISMTE